MTSIEALAKLAGDQAHPAWEVALLYPEQGAWTEGAYLRLTDQTNRLVELVDGRVEVLPMPSRKHQKIVALMKRSWCYGSMESSILSMACFNVVWLRHHSY